ncbi:MAG TPA: GGDEF domain-containing protein [Gemmatimonadales bacterium]|nr:GGDEF domain-containing protein [Gemmatimonadales bacterium]
MRNVHLLVRLLRYLDAVPTWRVLVYCVGLAVAVGAIQWVSPPELSLHVFYLGPVTMAAWHVGRWAGISLSALCAGLWVAARSAQAALLPIGSGLLLWDLGVLFLSFVIVASIVSTLRYLLDVERHRADRDPLTGLLNAASFGEAVEHERRHLTLTPTWVTLAYVDIDDFKEVNDRFGHAAGDELLRRVAGVLRHAVRDSDVVARLGGDEFGVLLPGAATEAAGTVLAKVHAALEAALAGEALPVGVSIGAVTFGEPLQSAQAMVHLADQLMYEVKRSGKGRLVHRSSPPSGRVEPVGALRRW